MDGLCLYSLSWVCWVFHVFPGACALMTQQGKQSLKTEAVRNGGNQISMCRSMPLPSEDFVLVLLRQQFRLARGIAVSAY